MVKEAAKFIEAEWASKITVPNLNGKLLKMACILRFNFGAIKPQARYILVPPKAGIAMGKQTVLHGLSLYLWIYTGFFLSIYTGFVFVITIGRCFFGGWYFWGRYFPPKPEIKVQTSMYTRTLPHISVQDGGYNTRDDASKHASYLTLNFGWSFYRFFFIL